MSFKEEEKRNKFLYAFYQAAKAHRADCPEAWRLGFSKYNRFSLRDRAIVDNSEEKSGYILGEKLAFSAIEIDGFLNYFTTKGYLEASLGNQLAGITTRGIEYLERLEEEPILPFHFNANNITINNGSGNVLLQNEVNHSTQSQQIGINKEALETIFSVIDKSIEHLSDDIKMEYTEERNYALRQVDKGKSPLEQLQNIGVFILKRVPGVIDGLTATGIWEGMKHYFGIS